MDDLDDWLDCEASLAVLQGVAEGGALDQPLSPSNFEAFADGLHTAAFDPHNMRRMDSTGHVASISPFAGLGAFSARGERPEAMPARTSSALQDEAPGSPPSSSRFASLPHYVQRAELGPLQLPDDSLPRAFSTPAPGLIGGGDGPFGGATAFGADADFVVDTASNADATAAAETAAERPTRARSAALTSSAIPEVGSKALLGPGGGGGSALGRSSSRAAALMPAVPRAAAEAGSSGSRRCAGGRNPAARRPACNNMTGKAEGQNGCSADAAAALLAKAAELGVSPKRMKRILANRRSAAAAKARKAEYHRDLEREVQELRRRVAQIDAGAHQSNERAPDAAISSGSDQAAAGSASARRGRVGSRKQRGSSGASQSSPGDATGSDADDCMPEEAARLRAELARRSAELAAARRDAVVMMQRAQRAEAAQAELSSRVAEMHRQLRAAAAEIPRLRAALHSARAAAAGAMGAAATACGAGLQGGSADGNDALQGGSRQQRQRQPFQQQQQQHQQQPVPVVCQGTRQQQPQPLPPPMQLTASERLRPFMPLSALIAQRWGCAARSAAACGTQNRCHSLPCPAAPPPLGAGTVAPSTAARVPAPAASGFLRPCSGGGSTADGDAILRIGSDSSSTLPAPGGPSRGAPGGPPDAGGDDPWAAGLHDIAMMDTDWALSDAALQPPPPAGSAAPTGSLAAMSASFSSMTAFGGSGELAQGPGSGLPQLQPGQNGAAAATIPVERELSPWRPAAGAQVPGVGLAGYDSQSSLLEAERAWHAAWRQTQWAKPQQAPAGGGAAGWAAEPQQQQQQQQPLQGFLDLPTATVPPF